MTPRRTSCRQAGQASLEYAAVIALVAVLVLAVVGAAQQSRVERIVAYAVCKVQAAVGAGGGGSCATGSVPGQETAPDRPDGEQDTPWYCDAFGFGCPEEESDGNQEEQQDEDDQPWYCDVFGIGCSEEDSDPPAQDESVDVPEGMDPDSDLVEALQSTARGRETLKWLADNDIAVVFSDEVEGAYWDGQKMVIGEGYDNPAVIVHETNHAKYTDEGRTGDASTMDRDTYVQTMVDEEADGLTQQIQAAREFREAGHDVGRQPAEDVYDAAYEAAVDRGSSEAEAAQAAGRAVNAQFYADEDPIRSSLEGNPTYPDYYGDFWDQVN